MEHCPGAALAAQPHTWSGEELCWGGAEHLKAAQELQQPKWGFEGVLSVRLLCKSQHLLVKAT